MPLKLLLLAALLYAGDARSDYFNGFFPSYRGNHGQPPIISLELDPKASLDTDMRVAAREDRLEDLKKYLDAGADINSRSDTGETALMYAARNCSLRIVACLLDARANENARDDRGRTALMFASSDSCLPVVRLLLRGHEIDVSAHDREGRSALDYARRASALEYGGDSEEVIRLIRSHTRRNLQ